MKKILFGLVTAMVSFVGFSASTAGNWFHADCANDPMNPDYEVRGGRWLSPSSSVNTAPECLYDEDEWSYLLQLSDVSQSMPVTYVADCPTNSLKGDVTFRSEAKFYPVEELPPIDADAKTGVCALTNGNFYIVGYDSAQGANKWIDTRIPTEFVERVSVEVMVSTNVVTYTFRSQAWTDDESGIQIPLAVSARVIGGNFQKVCCSGSGQMFSLDGDFNEYAVEGFELVLPEVQGLEVTCVPARAEPGDEVTVYFADDAKISMVPSAVYVVQPVDEKSGTCALVLKEGEAVPYAVDPGARITDTGRIFLNYAAAYAAATDGQTIRMLEDATVGTNRIDKSVTVDIYGYDFSVVRDLLITGAVFKVVNGGDPADESYGFILDKSVITVAADATLDLSELSFHAEDGVAQRVFYGNGNNCYIKLDGALAVPELYNSANAFYYSFPGVFRNEDMPDGGVILVGDRVYTGTPSASPARFVIDGEIAYGQLAPEFNPAMYDSFDSLQDALDSVVEVWLLRATDEDVEFRRGSKVFATEGWLTGEIVAPRGCKVTYSTEESAYVVEADAPAAVTIVPPSAGGLFVSFSVYTNGVLAVEDATDTVVLDDLFVDDEIKISVDYDDPEGAVSCAAYDEGSLDGLSVKDVPGKKVTELFFIVEPEVTEATVTVTEPEIDYIDYGVTYILDGGSWAGGFRPKSVYTIVDDTFSLPVAANLVYAGHSFDGWYTNSTFLGEVVTEVTKGSTGDLRFYAKWNLVDVEIVLPTIAGITNRCDVAMAKPGDKVTVYFFTDTKFASCDSAQYTVQNNGTLVFSGAGEAPRAIDPAARIGTAIYRTFESAYAAANDGDTITIGADTHTAQSLVITNSVTVDFEAKSVYFDCPVLVTNDAKLTVMTSAQYGGRFGLNALFTVAEGSELDCSDLEAIGYGGIDIGENGRIENHGAVRFSNEGDAFAGNTANRFLFNDCPGLLDGVGIVDGGVVTIGGLNFTGDASAGRYVVDDEVACAVPDECDYEYVESYDSVQDALNAASNVTLTVASCSANLVFPVGRKVYAEDGALTGFLTPPEGCLISYDAGEGAYVLVEFTAEYTVTFNFCGARSDIVCSNVTADTTLGMLFSTVLGESPDVIPEGYMVVNMYTDPGLKVEADPGAYVSSDHTYYVELALLQFPGYIPDDEYVQSVYLEWADRYAFDVYGEYEDAFLLDCPPDEEYIAEALADFVITDFKKVDDEWVISIGGTEVKDGDRYGNGYVNIVTVPIAGASAGSEFFKATLTVLPIN